MNSEDVKKEPVLVRQHARIHLVSPSKLKQQEEWETLNSPPHVGQGRNQKLDDMGAGIWKWCFWSLLAFLLFAVIAVATQA